MKFKPMLSGKAPEDLAELAYPVLASPKLDGIRCIKLDGKALTRALKPIPNDYIRNWVEANLPDGIDGELLLRDWTAPYREVCSAVMRKTGEPDFTFAAFDTFLTNGGFRRRLQVMENWIAASVGIQHVLKLVPHSRVTGPKRLEQMMDYAISEGYEGLMVRCPEGPYKQGRSTRKEGYLLKIKLWADEEAEVIGIVEQMHNKNEAKKNALGRTERSTKKEGLIGAGTMGALKCRFEDGTEFEVGTGFDDEMRDEIWEEYDHGCDFMPHVDMQIVKVKYQPPPGGRLKGEKPRFPVFLGFRPEGS